MLPPQGSASPLRPGSGAFWRRWRRNKAEMLNKGGPQTGRMCQQFGSFVRIGMSWRSVRLGGVTSGGGAVAASTVALIERLLTASDSAFFFNVDCWERCDKSPNHRRAKTTQERGGAGESRGEMEANCPPGCIRRRLSKHFCSFVPII